MNIEQIEEQLINIEAVSLWGGDCVTMLKTVRGNLRETVYSLERNKTDSKSKMGALNWFFYNGDDPFFCCIQSLRCIDRCLEIPATETDQLIQLIEKTNLDHLSYINYRAQLASTGMGALLIVAKKVSDECRYIKQHVLTRDTEQVDIEREIQCLTDIERELRDVDSELLNHIESQFKTECIRSRKNLTEMAKELKRSAFNTTSDPPAIQEEKAYLSDSYDTATCKDDGLHPFKFVYQFRGNEISLTKTEYKIFKSAEENNGSITIPDLKKAVWSGEDKSMKTISSHVENIKRKLIETPVGITLTQEYLEITLG